jgi:N-methylhydantoinase B
VSHTVSKTDVFTSEIVRNGLSTAAIEMGKTLARTAHSTLLYDAHDFGVGIVDRFGSVWGEAPGISIFTGCLSETIKGGLAALGSDGYADGDVLIVNDPYGTGTHVSDTSIYMPVFWHGDLVAFAIATAHWADVGAKAPGGWCPDSTDVYQEGVCFSHQKLVAAGEAVRDMWGLIENNVRLPRTVRGDLEAKIAACRLGSARIHQLCDKYGLDGVRGAMASTIARTDETMRRQIAAFEDGVYTASVLMDSDGVTPGEHPRVAVTISVRGDAIHVSFEGSSPAVRGPINLPAIGTRGAVRLALKALLMPLDRTNEGHFLAVSYDLPPGLIVSPERPSPCDSYGYVNGAVGELVFQALAKVAPERAPAGGLQLLACFLSRTNPRDGETFMFIEAVHGGNGASAHADGATMARFADGDASNTSAEVIELRYPIRCERFELRPSVSGPGKWRGGLGVRRDYRVLEPAISLQTANENTIEVFGRGLAGGGDGRPSEVVLWPETERELTLDQRVSAFPLAAGDVVSLRSAGGGGWGPPGQRAPELVLSDVRDELLTVAEAAEIHGVIITHSDDGDFEIDQALTAARRRD